MNPALLPRALTAGLVAVVMAILPAGAQTALDKVSFGTNWVAEAEHGGFFQALADGTYKNYGLDVTIVPGGPNDNNRMLLIAGKLDFFMSANTLMSFDAVANNVPVVTVAAIFQKDPQVFLTHPEFEDRKTGRSQAADAVRVQGRDRQLFSMAEVRIWVQRGEGQALHIQPATLYRRQAKRDAGLRHLGAVRGRKGGQIQARDHLAGGLWFQHLLHLDRDPPRTDRQEAGPGSALRRCLDRRLVQLPLRRQRARQRDDQEAQSGNDRRVARLLRSPR